MGILSKEETKQILEKVVNLSKADSIEAGLSGNGRGNIRYARNTVTTSGYNNNESLGVTVNFGKRSASSTINEFDDKSLEKVVRRAEELAKLAPENPEFVEPLGPQEFKESKTFFKSTADITPEYRAEVAKNSIAPAKSKDITAAGYLEDSAGFNSMMNSKGLFAYNQSSSLDFTVTMRTNDGTGSGWVTRDFNDVSRFNGASASEIAIEKAAMSRNAKAIEPGKYTVIMEPAASVQLLGNMLYNMGARQADEGRSFLAKQGGGTKVGEKLLDERINIYSDPFNPLVPASTWSGDGRAQEKVSWIENGEIKNMFYSRYWAEKQGVEATPPPSNGIMVGGDATTEDLIKSTKRGILVTRLWYIRTVDPQTLLYTGLTRDGTFYIENGKIKHPIKNMRFNESPIIMLNNLEELGQQQRVNGNLVPVMKIRDFTFTSLSDAV